MGTYLMRKNLLEQLIISFVNEDLERDGFLDRRIINSAVLKNGMKLSKNQLNLLTQVLITNH